MIEVWLFVALVGVAVGIVTTIILFDIAGEHGGKITELDTDMSAVAEDLLAIRVDDEARDKAIMELREEINRLKNPPARSVERVDESGVVLFVADEGGNPVKVHSATPAPATPLKRPRKVAAKKDATTTKAKK
jgi:hypothetical protein